MNKETKIKEAIKAGLAFALVYGIALEINWLSPSWAGWSVAAIAGTSRGESLQKGLLRIWGTLLACVMGIAIISAGAQNRWLFMLLTAGWLFFSSYNMLASKERSYFWFCAAYVALVITAAGPSSAGGFYIAVYRTIETIMGIVVYTLISVFLWPRTNMGAIKKALSALLDTQTKLFKGVYKVINGKNQLDHLKELVRMLVNQSVLFNKSITSEGSENVKIQDLKPMLDQYESLNISLQKSLDRLFGGMEDLSRMDLPENQSDIDNYFKEINLRFTGMSNLLANPQASIAMQDVKLRVDSIAPLPVSHFDRAAVAIIITELYNIETISREMADAAMNIAETNLGSQRTSFKEVKSQKKPGFRFPVFDIENLKGSFYVALVIIVGFLIWFYANPPGHATWYILGGVFALIFAAAQQVRTVKLVVPFVVAMFLISLIYVFILPNLTMFYQLGIILFVCMFVIQYFLSGPAIVVYTITLIQLLVINNPQTYDPSALVNSFVFIPMLMLYLFGMSYLINSPRPEKKFLRLMSRFFKSAKYLISEQSQGNTDTESSFIQKYKTAFYQHELVSLPAKIKAWGKSIDKKQFPNTDDQQIDEIVNTLQVMVVRMETLIDANSNSHGSSVTQLNDTIMVWRQRLGKTFDSWDNLTKKKIKSNAAELVLKMMDELEEKLKVIEAKNKNRINEEEGIQFYHLLGGYRGVTDATLSFVKVADQLDWKQWKEERFP